MGNMNISVPNYMDAILEPICRLDLQCYSCSLKSDIFQRLQSSDVEVHRGAQSLSYPCLDYYTCTPYVDHVEYDQCTLCHG